MLPSLHSAMRSDPDAVSRYRDCTSCKARTRPFERQLIGCGYEPPHPSADPWQGGAGYEGPRNTTCPGYTTSLPEVVEASWARFYLSKGNLEQWTGGAPATELVREAIQHLEVATAADEAARQKAT